MDLRNSLPASIAGTGAAFPQRFVDGDAAELDNDAVIRLLAPSGPRGPRRPEEIHAVSAALAGTLGVERRRWSHRVGRPSVTDEPTSRDLQVEALRRALEDAGLAARELAAVVATSSTPPRVTSASAPAIAAALGVSCAAYDVRAGCAGGVFALVNAHLLVSACQAPIAVVAGDTFSRILPPTEPVAGLAFGDGAGALVLVPTRADSALLSASLCCDGALAGLAAAPAPFPPSLEAIERGDYFLQGDAEELTRQSVPRYLQVIQAALAGAKLDPDALDLYIPHQSSKGLIEKVAQAAGIAVDKTVIRIADHANIGSGSVLVALHEARKAGEARTGMRVLIAALGGGLCWGAALLRL